MPLFCKHCGNALNEGSKFCGGCGNAVAVSTLSKPAPIQENTCSACGYALNPGAKFCKGCGKAVEAQAAPQQVKGDVVSSKCGLRGDKQKQLELSADTGG